MLGLTLLQFARFEKHLAELLWKRGYVAPSPHSDFE